MTDRDQLEAVGHDAAHYPGGKAFALVKPTSEAESAAILQRYAKILPVGAQAGLSYKNAARIISTRRQVLPTRAIIRWGNR